MLHVWLNKARSFYIFQKLIVWTYFSRNSVIFKHKKLVLKSFESQIKSASKNNDSNTLFCLRVCFFSMRSAHETNNFSLYRIFEQNGRAQSSLLEIFCVSEKKKIAKENHTTKENWKKKYNQCFRVTNIHKVSFYILFFILWNWKWYKSN